VARKNVAFRKSWFVMGAAAGVVGSPALFAGLTLSHPNGSEPFGAVVGSLLNWLLWLAGWHSAVRMDSTGIVIDNLIVRNVIPWSALETIEVSGGLKFRLRDGTSVGSFMYGGSLIGEITRYPYTRRVAERMRKAQAEFSPGVPGTLVRSEEASVGWHISPWPPLVILVIMESIAVLAVLSR